MELTKYIYINNNSLSEEISDEIIDLFNSDAKKELKNKLFFDIFDKNNICKMLLKELEKNVENYLRYLNTNNIFSVTHKLSKTKLEKMIIQKYEKNEIIKEEIIDNNLVFSKLFFIWYLNDVEEGGETEFWNGEYCVKPETGKLIIFPSCWTFPFKEKIPISCDKYVIKGYLLNDE